MFTDRKSTHSKHSGKEAHTMAIIYFIGETVEQGIKVKKEVAEEMVKTSNGKLAMQEVE